MYLSKIYTNVLNKGPIQFSSDNEEYKEALVKPKDCRLAKSTSACKNDNYIMDSCHRIAWVKQNLKDHSVPTPCHRQFCHSPDQAALSPT